MSADSLLRPALEAAVAVARSGEGDVPVQAAPVGLRPFLNFARLPSRALVAARRALDADDAFRARVVAEVSEDAVGHAGWIFLVRPDGWEVELDALARRSEEDRARVDDHRAEDGARRRLGAAEEAGRRAEEAAAAARAEASRAGAALAEERRIRRAATSEAADLARRADALAVERDQAVADAARARAVSARARTEATTARSEATAARADAAAAIEAGKAADAEAEAADDRRSERASAVVDQPSSVMPPGAVSVEGAGALAAAAGAARALADALGAAARSLGRVEPMTASPRRTPGSPASPPASPPSSRSRRPRVTPRVAAPLPPAIFEESSEAAEHLARLPGVVILVDGYNVSHAGWPGTAIADQRRRLVDALGELVARTGADVRVVFDGADIVEPPIVATTARAVRVTFSPPDVEADDVIVAEVGQIPPHRPVVVASSDRRVRDESRARGANLLRSSQLLVLLRR